MRKRKNTTAKLTAFGYLVGAKTGTCEGCRRWPRAVKYVEMHWQHSWDRWTTVQMLCGTCTALLFQIIDDGGVDTDPFGSRYPFVT